ncbi:hypothetical protein [Peribacillus frigoritolerans]|uniref:hypothetical protein n=1 Tax=Peribacillus frigoritolerans TaxID=450367 RepID=UPI002E22F59F|nr:hypothetical protein [Peribacillus frigoritolerans]MED3847490.1 hypothetical protein [Peribacillus frigoritolerans]
MFELINSKSSKQVGQALKKLEQVSDIIPTTDVLNFFNKLTDAYTEAKVTKREIAKIQAQKEVLLTEIEKRYELYHKVFDHIFDEREVAIAKSFEIIDKGLNEGDKDLISYGMQGLCKVVSSSPFANIEQLSKMIEGNKIIEI